jgi:hypothetical protein
MSGATRNTLATGGASDEVGIIGHRQLLAVYSDALPV